MWYKVVKDTTCRGTYLLPTPHGATVMNILNSESLRRHMDPKNNYLSDEVIQGEIVSEDIPEESNLKIEEKAGLGRGTGNSNIPDFLRKTISSLAQDHRGKDIAEAFDVSNSVVSQAKQGRISQSTGVESSLVPVIKTKQEQIKDEALEKTLHTLGLLTLDDIGLLGAKDKADVATKLAKVAECMTSKDSSITDNRVQFIIHAPPVKTVTHYQEIEA